MAAYDWSPRAAAYAASVPHSAGPSLEKVLVLAAPRPGDRALDIGTGAGHTAALLAAAGASVVGLDQSEGMLAAARNRYSHVRQLTFQQGDAAATGLDEKSFDLITARHTLHHHADIRATLAEVRRLLRPGGRLVLVDETSSSPALHDWFEELERSRDASHVRTHTVPQWRSLLEGSGLRWVVGDDLTRYRMDVAAWFDRAGLSDAQRVTVQELFAAAPAEARRFFAVEYDPETGDALTFAMPMALIVALRPAEEEE